MLRGTRRVFLPWVKKIFLIVSKSLLITRNTNDDILVRLRPGTIENEIFESRAHLHRLCHPPQQLDCMDVVYIEYDRFNYLSNSGFPSFTNKSFAFH